MGLTPAQQEAYDAIRSRLDEGATYTALRGYAGTGKSHLVGRLAADLAGHHEILLTAPTHKAAQVLREMGQERGLADNLPVRTLHSALGLRLTPNGEGGYALSPAGEGHLPSRGLVIADEASMIGAALWQYVQQTDPRLNWLFIGDPAQLPPVGESSSPALTQDGPLLTSVVRQAAENPIIRLATRIRQGNLSLKELGTAYADGEGIGMTGSLEQFAESAARHFSSEAFEEDPSACRILAYRNRRVQHYNRLIRRQLHGEDTLRFLKGEWIVATATWNGPGPGITMHNSEELKVEKASTGTVTGRGGRWKVWTLKAWSRHAEKKKTLLVLHEEEKDRFEEELARRKDMALADPKGWEAYYEMKEQFAQVDYAYAMTTHKAQGSTLDTGYVDWRDLTFRSGGQQAPLLYVAVTRPAKRLALLV